MYTGGGDDLPGKDVPSHVIPTDSERWKLLRGAFVGANSLRIVELLEAGENTPLLIKDHPWIKKGMLGGMNTALYQKSIGFMLKRVYDKLPWAEQAVRFVEVER
ncbi:MAG: hypothetical protein JWN50_554 [Parcubacteria group bacterium]|nr:hypothetical protein [Parcubacteria group bacterium]